MIKTATKIRAHELISKKAPEHVWVTCQENGDFLGLRWLYESQDTGLYGRAKKRGGKWVRGIGWTFSDPSIGQGLVDAILKKHPDWPLIGNPSKPHMPLAGIKISHVQLDGGFHACLVPLPLPYFTDIDEKTHTHVFEVANGKKEIGLLIDTPAEIAATVNAMVEQGAVCDDSLAKRWPFTTDGRKPQVSVTGWAVQITCDLSNLRHYLVLPELKYYPKGGYSSCTKVATSWNGTINSTRLHWPNVKSKFLSIGLEWEGDDPEAELVVPTSFDESRVAGWDAPAPNGFLLHAYQKEGAQFCASRGMRALIGDEMGVGKTVQAIAAAEAGDTDRILVICPANARYVWEREILGWGGRGRIQHVTSQLDKLKFDARWHIVTYDLITARDETWSLYDEQEKNALLNTFPELEKEIKMKRDGSYPCKVTFNAPLIPVPVFSDPKRVAAWGKMMQRLRGELMEQFLSCGKMLVILDEAHRAKNRTSKRTKAIQGLVADETKTKLLMLTGTPMRNNEHEAAVLLSLLDAEASKALSPQSGYNIQDIKDYLNHFMIRRTKAEVLPDLPPKTRQRIDIGGLDPVQMQAYHMALDRAFEAYNDAKRQGKSEVEARQCMQGGIERARTALGVAKIRGGEVADLVLEVVENKDCCVVFCAHHQASDDLRAQLNKEGLRVEIVDGRVSQKDRAKIVDDFQTGKLDVFIGGINAAGEAITLTRADTVIFVELDWVPAAMLQAEDRIHRFGQQAHCQVIQLVARTTDGDNLDEMMIDIIGSKVNRIGSVLNEDTENIIAGCLQSELHVRLLAGYGQTDAS